MAFATSPSSVNSNFSLSDSVSDIVILDMTDDYAKPAPDKEVFEFQPVFEKEGSLNSSMITVIVSLSRHTCCTLLLQIFSSTGRRHPLSSRFSLPPKRIRHLEGHHYRIRD